MDLAELLKKAREFHGHSCPFLALGIRISDIAMKNLEIVSRDEGISIAEDVLAIVECNNCLTDGVQVATGCTFGNNSLIYLDLGKNALTLVRRSDWNGVRIYVETEKIRKYFDRRALELFDKVVVKRSGSSEELKELSELWEKISWKMLEIPEKEFKIERVKVEPIERAPIFKDSRCKKCGESVMITRIKDGLCLKCSGSYYAVVGRGIVKFENSKMEEVVL
ncbi:MAG: FmdE family protein [Archaeoglobaceae archaeon]|nr:FmdE family protein [Archaeoglobaceae archaeon]MCX8152756.1 FmdE family protein [Archaeoglobaceae archaeon]MDW8013463.1 FmdE family protein [Archaeoglobaceae archaeon]